MGERLVGEFDDLDGFLGDKRSQSSFGIVKWKDREPPVIDTWMSRRRMPIKVFRHSVPQLVSWEKDGEAKEKVFSLRGRCWEPAEAFEWETNPRDKKTGKLKIARTNCPDCMFAEWLREELRAGRVGRGHGKFTTKSREEVEVNLGLVEPLFVLKGEDDDEETVVHVGGFLGMFNDRLDDDHKRLLSKEGILLTDAWKEDGSAKKNYLFTIADNDDLGEGLQKALEGLQLGMAVQTVIEQAQESLGVERGNPFKHPYCVRWKCFPKAKFPQPRFAAVRMEEVKATGEVMDVVNAAPPDVSEEMAYLVKDELREKLEAACVLKGVPWDRFFKGSAPTAAARSDSAKPAQRPYGEKDAAKEANELERRSAEDRRSSEEGENPNPLGLDPEDPHTVACEATKAKGSDQECGALMRDTDARCAYCGAVYGSRGGKTVVVRQGWEKDEKPPSAAPRKRSEATTPPSTSKQTTASDDDPDEDEIPF